MFHNSVTHSQLNASMLSRLVAAVWGQGASQQGPSCVRTEHGPAISTHRATSGARSAECLPTLVEVQLAFSRVFTQYSSISSQHRALFSRYMALSKGSRDKVSANMMGIMDSLEHIAEALMQADARVNAEQVPDEPRLAMLDGGELREIQFDVREAEIAVQFVRSRVERIGGVIGRMETESPEHDYGFA